LLLTRKHTFIFALTFLLLLPAMQQSQAEDAPSRETLTQATFELHRDLLLAQEKHLSEERTGLIFYLNINNLPSSKFDSISITLADKQVLKSTFDEKQLTTIASGGMQKLGAIQLSAGKHELIIQLKTDKRNITKTIELEKSAGRDNLKITITKLMQQRNPEIIFEHETWTAVQ